MLTPMTKPPMAISSEYREAETTAWRTVVSEPRTSGCRAPAHIVQTCGIAESEVLNGSATIPPSHLTSSHMTMVSAMPASAQSTPIAPALDAARDGALPTRTRLRRCLHGGIVSHEGFAPITSSFRCRGPVRTSP